MPLNKQEEFEQWDIIIEPKTRLLDINFKEIWKYRDLIFLIVKREIIASYQQTIIGPLWYLLHPILVSLSYFIAFGKIANINTGEIPQILFYLSGISIWNYFLNCLNNSSTLLLYNAPIFSKVYFPRLIVPISELIINLIRFFFQLIPFVVAYILYAFNGLSYHPSWQIILLPVVLFAAGIFGTSLGLIITSITIKYRDLSFLVNVFSQAVLFLTTVIYPLEKINNITLKKIIQFNPMTWVIENFRVICFNHDNLKLSGLGYSLAVILILSILAIIIFNKTEKTFIDTV
jgi:lipopolysaccharide transport system permease protein